MLERLHLALAPDELGQPALRGELEVRPQRAEARRRRPAQIGRYSKRSLGRISANTVVGAKVRFDSFRINSPSPQDSGPALRQS
jgi:hypothetical protein